MRAAEILYTLDERDMLASIYAELGESATDIAGMAMMGELAAKNGDGRAMVLLGEYAYGRGLPLDYYAYPIVGLPDYQPIAPPIEAAVAYSIARQESHFNQKVVSSANAMGLMQVTPAAGIDTAAKFKVTYNRDRLLKDPVYNMQMGAAELSNLFTGYNGSYILTFAGYNAGRGRVKQWIAAYGDPRDPRCRPGRLGRADPDRRDAQLRRAHHGEPAGLPRALRRRHQAGDRGRPQARRRALIFGRLFVFFSHGRAWSSEGRRAFARLCPGHPRLELLQSR